MKIKYLILFFGILFRINAYSQEIKITASNKSLSQVLIEIRDKYDLEFSFNDTELSKYQINVKKSFKNIDKTLEYLLKNLPFEFEKVSGIYIIYPKKIEFKPEEIKPKVYSISGRIMEFKTKEYLPYSQIIINNFGIISDQNGNFSFSSTSDSIFRIKISQLGYLVKDTIIFSGSKNVSFYLIPSDQILNEITINENLIESFVTTGSEVATIKLNHKVSKYLPGSSDNSVFNLLRLQPGILASGEQTSDVVIWGTYPGQSRILFDGFTLFGLKNYNDNISSINPLIVKNIQLKKAGYDASYGDCIGGIADISGKDGNNQNAHINFGINNFTLNGLAEVPILKKSSLQLAYRQTYYNLYKNGIQLFPKANSNISDIYVYPDYQFRDFNLKYTVKTDKNFFFVSLYRGNDQFDYSFTSRRQYREIVKSVSELNRQTGGSFFLEKKFNSKLNSGLTVSYSSLKTDFNDQYEIFSTITTKLVRQKDFEAINQVSEIKANLKTTYQTRGRHFFEFNIQALNNSVVLKEDSFDIQTLDIRNDKTYYTFGFKDIIGFQNKNLDLGFRVSYLPYIKKAFMEPRFSYSQVIGADFKLNLAWGIYRQFLVKSSIIDDYGNFRYMWAISDNENIPVLLSNHLVTGFSYNRKNYSFNIDAFYKTTDGLTRYIELLLQAEKGIYTGNAKSFGADFYAKYNFKEHTIWISYTLSKTIEHFSYFSSADYSFAPQDQRHEIKIASIINLSPFYLSANYVYGSGFLERPYLQKISSNRLPYNRLDISATYQFSKKRNFGEAGISVLNVLNTENQKVSNFEKVPVSQSSSVRIYYEAMPFTPTIFLKLYF